MGRNTYQHAVAVVQPGMHQGNYQLLECGGRYTSADLTQLTKSGKATRHRFLDMHPHRQVIHVSDSCTGTVASMDNGCPICQTLIRMVLRFYAWPCRPIEKGFGVKWEELPAQNSTRSMVVTGEVAVMT